MKPFRLVSLVEGASLLVLLSGAVPLRYYGGLHGPVWYAGWTHGLLFLTYGGFALAISHLREWSVLRWLAIFLLGAVPFGFLVVDAQLRRSMEAAGESPP